MSIVLTGPTKRNLLAPALAHAASSGALPMLASVRVFAGDGFIGACATDRYTMGFQRTAHDAVKAGDFDFLVPAREARVMCSPTVMPRNGSDLIPLSFDAYLDTPESYPKLGDVLKGKKVPRVTLGSFDPSMWGRFAVAEKLNGARLKWRAQGGLFVVSVGPNFVGALMSRHIDAPPIIDTTWTEVAP